MTIVFRDKTEKINFISTVCQEILYIYIQKTNSVETSKLEISVDYLPEECEFFHFNSFSYCGETSLAECRRCARAGCVSIDCGYEFKERFVINLY